MKKRTREIRMPKLRMDAQFDLASMDAEARTAEIRWYTGATIMRASMFDGPYRLTFSLDPKAVRLDRLSSGRAPFKRGHMGNDDPRVTIGVIEKAWLAEDGGRAVVRFSPRDEVTPLFEDVRAGILGNVSMEAAIHELEDVTEKGEALTHLMATDWEPLAVALVSVGADPGAQALSEDESDTVPCKFHVRASAPAEAPRRADAPKGEPMKIKVRLLADVEGLGASGDIVEILKADFDSEIHAEIEEPTPPTPKVPGKQSLGADPKAAKRAVDDALERKQELEAQVKRAGAAYGMDAVFVRRHINLGTDVEQFIELCAEERAKRAPKTENDIGFGEDYDSIGWRAEQMAEALSARARRQEVPESARQYGDSTLVELAYECLGWRGMARGLNPRRHSSRIVQLALSTSDYPNLLANAANKSLLPDYEHAMPTYRLLAERQDLPDFKTASVLKAGDFPVPLEVGESGEIKLGSFSEAKDTYALATYGRRLLFSFQSIVNDDLGAFGRIMRGAAMRLADFENALWFALLTSASGAGPTLGDGTALFATGHGNLTSSGTVINVDNLGIGRASMRKQTSLDGLKLNIVPRYLLTSPDKETVARQYTTVIQGSLVSSNVNPWAGTLEPIADANLTTANPWYLFADPMRAPVSVYGYLSGQAGPNVATRQGFEVLGVEMVVALHFGTAFVDFRGAYRNAGA